MPAASQHVTSPKTATKTKKIRTKKKKVSFDFIASSSRRTSYANFVRSFSRCTQISPIDWERPADAAATNFKINKHESNVARKSIFDSSSYL